MNCHFLDAARDEFAEAIGYYEQQRTGLGKEFANEVQRTVQRILERPESFPRLSHNARRCRTKRFPYGVVYALTAERDILIVAVMHLHRKPGYWKQRLA